MTNTPTAEELFMCELIILLRRHDAAILSFQDKISLRVNSTSNKDTQTGKVCIDHVSLFILSKGT